MPSLQKLRQAKKRTTRIIDRITYSPNKHKNREKRERRKKLLKKVQPDIMQSEPIKPTIKFGSFNVNGLDLEAEWAINQILITRNFDVSEHK